MFSFSDSKKKLDALPVVRHVIDVTTPNRVWASDTRQERRYNRSMPILLCPSKNQKPLLSEVHVAVTQDFSDSGIGLISSRPVTSLEFLAVVWPFHDNVPAPILFQCGLAHYQPLTPELYFVGLGIDCVVECGRSGKLAKLMSIAQTELRPVEDD